MTLKLRLLISLTLLGICVVALGVAGYAALEWSSERTRSIVDNRVVPLEQLKVVADLYAVSIVDTVHKVRSTALSWEQGRTSVAEARKVIESTWNAYLATSLTDQEKQLVADAVVQTAAAEAPLEKLKTILETENRAALIRFAEDELYPIIDPISTSMSALIQLQVDVAFEEFASAKSLQQRFSLVGACLAAFSLAVFAYALWVVLGGVIKPITALDQMMQKLAAGDLATEVPFTQKHDEIGTMARSVEVFRINAAKIADMTDAEAVRVLRDEANRRDMMSALHRAFGTVVDAAMAGDFTKRVDATFADKELNALAGGVNGLVEVVDRSIRETGDVLSALARTDLTKRVTADCQGALAQLKNDTNAVADRLSDVVTQLRGTSRSLKSATGEILVGTNDLAERTTKQAAAIEQTSAAMEQLASTVTDNARKAQDVAMRTHSAAQLADEGGQVMEQATQAMGRISTSSAKISNIIGLIDDVAFQTNLLALNASVEAARAGEAGKGFAVVAVEVRRLAQSAAQASADVKVLIEQSSQEVSGGTKLVDTAAHKLQAILAAVRENSVLMQAISSASSEQSSAIAEVSTAVRQMDEMTQHNAALVEQTNAAIEQTEAQAVELDKIVDVFKIEGRGEPQAAPAPQAKTAKTGIRALQAKVKSAAKSYLSHGNAAVKQNWSEF